MTKRFGCDTRLVLTLIALAVALFVGAPALAGDVEFKFTQRETWVGSPAVLTVTVHDGSTIGDPVCPTVDGLDFSVQPGRQTMSSMQFINGQVARENTTTMTVFVTPTRPGRFTVPPIRVMVDGTDHASQPTTISSLPSTTGDLLSAEVVGEPSTAWVGQSMKAILRILVKPYRSQEHRVSLDEGDMWQFIDLQRSELGIFRTPMTELQQRGQRPMGREELVGGSSYLVYEVAAEFTPTTPGIPNFGDVRIAWNYPTRITENRGFFGRAELAVSATKPIAAHATARGIDVRALPSEGRPREFTGAIGNFSIEASAKPLRVGVGDPITLTIVVRDLQGADALAQLQPPLLDTPELERDFRMPSAPLAGTIAGKTKTFTQTLRPVRAGIESIPSIAFAWFDPASGTYRNTATASISLEVVPSERISTLAILGVGNGSTPPELTLTPAGSGLVANIAPTAAMVADARMSGGTLATAAIMGVPPLLCAAVLFVRRRRERLAGDSAFARAKGARAEAKRHLMKGDATAALLGFIADSTNTALGTLTRADARGWVERAGASDLLVEKVDSLLASAERSRFAASGSAASETADISQVAAVIKDLGRLQWARACESRTETNP